VPAAPPSSASPWAPWQARNAKRDRPTSARPILPAQFAFAGSLSRPLLSLDAHGPSARRQVSPGRQKSFSACLCTVAHRHAMCSQDLARPDAAAPSGDVNELCPELNEISQKGMQIVLSSVSLEGSSSLNDLSQRWLSDIEVAARKAEPAGPKNLTRFLIQQKCREVEEHKARILDLSQGTSELRSPLASPRGQHKRGVESLPEDAPECKWHELIRHLSFVQQLSAEIQVASPCTLHVAKPSRIHCSGAGISAVEQSC